MIGRTGILACPFFSQHLVKQECLTYQIKKYTKTRGNGYNNARNRDGYIIHTLLPVASVIRKNALGITSNNGNIKHCKCQLPRRGRMIVEDN